MKVSPGVFRPGGCKNPLGPAAHRLRSRRRRIAIVAAATVRSNIVSRQTMTGSPPAPTIEAVGRAVGRTADRAVGFSR
jgi:hypothetical protein